MKARPARLIVRLMGFLLIAVALGGLAYPIWWNHRSKEVGHTLLENASLSLAVPRTSASCPSSAATATRPIGSTPGILEIPSIGLVAPVLNGLSDAVLNVAVGHDPQTNWPGAKGESIVEAHDVSYFSNLSRVHAGATVIWLTPCSSSQFRVLTTAVRRPGDVLYTPSGGSGLALITCFPTDALFWTPTRFVVTTRLVSRTLTHETLPPPNPSPPSLQVPAPAALVAQGLQLDQNSLLMGVLTIGGTPSAAFTSGPGPLAIEAQALEEFFGAEKAVQQRNPTWWVDLTVPGVAFRASWPSFAQANVSMTVSGLTPTLITISSGASVVTIVNHNNVLLISSVS